MKAVVRRKYVAWMGRSQVQSNPPHEGMRLEESYTTRGLKRAWQKEDWPPIRVLVTVAVAPSARMPGDARPDDAAIGDGGVA